MTKPPLENLIEAALFFKGGALSYQELAEVTETSEEDVIGAVGSLKVSLEGRGLSVVLERDLVALATAAEAHEMIERMRRTELDGPLGKAGLETISIVIFRGPLSKSDIEYVRGVNCSSILRSLLIRGLIERIDNPNDKRSFLYRATPELPAYLGLSSLTDIPGYAETRENIEKIFAERQEATERESDEEKSETTL